MWVVKFENPNDEVYRAPFDIIEDKWIEYIDKIISKARVKYFKRYSVLLDKDVVAQVTHNTWEKMFDIVCAVLNDYEEEAYNEEHIPYIVSLIKQKLENYNSQVFELLVQEWVKY